MKIAFDFHGVLETHPDRFKAILRPLRIDHTIIILSGPPLDQIYDELKKCNYLKGYHYDYALSVVDWLKKKGVKMSLNEHGSWYCGERTWWRSKSRICKENNIEILFDDNLNYKKYIIDNNPLFLHIK